MITDAWMGYHGIAGLGYTHVRRSQRGSPAPVGCEPIPGKLLPRVNTGSTP